MTQYIGAVPESAKQEVIAVDAGTYTNTRRNSFLNSSLMVNQRGYATAATVRYAFAFHGDMLFSYIDVGSGSSTTDRSSDVPSIAECGVYLAASAGMTTVTAASAPTGTEEAELIYRMEGYDYAKLTSENYFTLSFWVKTSQTGTHVCSLAGAAAINRYFIFEYNVPVADKWTRITKTIPVDTTGAWDKTDGRGLQVAWHYRKPYAAKLGTASDSWQTGALFGTANQVDCMGGVGDYVRFAGIQVEPGIVASPLSQETYTEELARCKRYYQRLPYLAYATYPGWRDGTTGLMHTMELPVEMRDTPTSGGLLDGASPTITVRRTQDNATMSTTGAVNASINWNSTKRAAGIYINGGLSGLTNQVYTFHSNINFEYGLQSLVP